MLVCPECGHRWLTLGAAALSEAEAQTMVLEHTERLHPGQRQLLESFVPPPPAKKPRPPSRRNRR